MDHRAIRTRARRQVARLIGALAALALVLPAPAVAWGYFGHRTTAQIALANVRPETRAAITRLLAYEAQIGTPDCSLATLEDASTWPDCVRREGWRWGYTGAWHYRTAPVCEAYDPRANCAGGNCVTAQIERNQRVLADESLPGNVRLEALAFMVHFAGDVHMPLHSGDKDDRGGNDRVTAYGIVPGLNLHSIWDSALAERAITSADPPLVRRYSDAERAAIATGGPHDWGRESWQIAREFVYRTAFDRDPCDGDLPLEAALTQEDIVEAIPVSQQRVTQAGLRIARMLDEAFAPGALVAPER
jgi:hypothetical protein